MKNIILIEPKSPDFHIYSRYGLPRLGTVLLGTILQKNGYNVKVYVENIEEIDFEHVFSSDLVGISTITSTAPRAYELAKQVKEQGVPVLLGGAHPTYMVEEALRFSDFVLRGEAENSILKFVKALEFGQGFDEVPGLSYIKNGEIFNNNSFEPCADLNTLPFPNFSLISGFDKKLKKINITPIMTSRGCPYDCSFCSVTLMFGHKYRFRGTESVLEELKRIETKYVFFYDDNFTASPSRTKELLRAMIYNRITPKWTAQVRTDIARDKELIDLMQKSNCHACYIGLESVNPDTLKEYNKRQTLEDIESCIYELHKRGIWIHGMFVLGADQDSVDTIRETARFAKRHRIDSIQIMILTPMPGTRYYNEIDRQGRLITKDWSLYDGHHVVFSPKGMTLFELQLETIKAMAKFYSLWQTIKKFMKFDLKSSIITGYGNRLVRLWKKRNQYFIDLVQEWGETKKRYEIKARQTADDMIEKVKKFKASKSQQSVTTKPR